MDKETKKEFEEKQEVNNLEVEMSFEENEEIEQILTLDSFHSTSSYNADMSLDLINNYYIKGKFVLDPEFQRRDVWNEIQQSKFIESIMLNIPIPSILLADDKTRNHFIVIDGKQRITAILNFFASEKDGNGLKLKGLEVLKELNGYNYAKLEKDPTKISHLSQLENYTIRSTIVKNYDEKLLYFIFARLNSGSVPLSTQELRHTLYPGNFSKFINESSKENIYVRQILNLKDSYVDKRMRDAELLCRYYSFKYFLNDYNNTVGGLLDLTYENLNKKWSDIEDEIKNDLFSFNESMNFIFSQLGDKPFRVYFPDRNEYGNFNRLMFDLLSTTFSIETNRDLVLSSSISLESFIQDIFINDVEFLDAFKPVTSSRDKTLKRFNIFNSAFKEKFRNDK